jgi:hypothetical protein
MSYFGIPIRNGLPIGLGSVAPLASGGGSAAPPVTFNFVVTDAGDQITTDAGDPVIIDPVYA